MSRDTNISSAAASARRCWAEIDLAALRHNVRVVQEKIGPHARIMAVVKANAYGHGMSEVANAIRENVAMFGVANLAEARALRDALDIQRCDILKNAQQRQNPPGIFILGTALPDEREEIVRSDFIPAISGIEEAATFSALADSLRSFSSTHKEEKKPRMKIHLVIDTGMGRIGVWENEAFDVAQKISRFPNLEITGIATHLPVADEDENFTAEQLAHFERLLAKLGAAGVRAPLVHSLNSAGVIRFSAHAEKIAQSPQNEIALVRTGLMLYGSSPIPDFQKNLRAVMTLKTRVTLVRDFGVGRGVSYGRTFITKKPMRIATLAIGYADGYPRHLSNSGVEVLIRGKRCAVLGRVTMDQIMADVTALPREPDEIRPGEEVVLFGKQRGEEIFAAELAQKAGTIAWEIFTGIGPRVERVYEM